LLLIPQASIATPSFVKKISKSIALEKLKKKDLKNSDIKIIAAFVYTVLSNTSELRIHQMNGEVQNQVYIKDDGTELVVAFDLDGSGNIIDGTGSMVEDCINQGSYNYHHQRHKPLGHFAVDILPWLVWGNCKEDISILSHRAEAYILDLREGYASMQEEKVGLYLPEKFKFKGVGQSESVAFFIKALAATNFNLVSFIKEGMHNPAEQEDFFNALEVGIKELLKNV